MLAGIGQPLGGGGVARAKAPEQPEGVGATAWLGAGSGGGVAQEERARGVGGAGGTGASVRGGGTQEAAIGATDPRGSRRSARQERVAPALLQVSRRGERRPWTVFRKGGRPGPEWVETEKESAEFQREHPERWRQGWDRVGLSGGSLRWAVAGRG